MFVRNQMIPAAKVITLSREQTLKEALEIMSMHGHDALPVVLKDKVVGVLSKNHIFKTFFLNDYTSKEDFLVSTKVHEQMKTDYRTITPDDLLESALQTMGNMRMQFLTVVSPEGTLKGLLTKQSLLQTFANSLGMGKRGTRVEVVLDDIEGRLATLTKLFSKTKINIISIIMVDPAVLDLKKIILRLDTKEKDSIVEMIEQAGFRVMNAFIEE